MDVSSNVNELSIRTIGSVDGKSSTLNTTTNRLMVASGGGVSSLTS
jgi:hypothetical protein